LRRNLPPVGKELSGEERLSPGRIFGTPIRGTLLGEELKNASLGKRVFGRGPKNEFRTREAIDSERASPGPPLEEKKNEKVSQGKPSNHRRVRRRAGGGRELSFLRAEWATRGVMKGISAKRGRHQTWGILSHGREASAIRPRESSPEGKRHSIFSWGGAVAQGKGDTRLSRRKKSFPLPWKICTAGREGGK